MYGRLEGTLLLSHLLYQSGTFQCIKKCFVCKKVSCWSSNHLQQEQNNLKKKFGNHYPKYKA